LRYKAEHIKHTFAGWTTLAPSEYTDKIRLKVTDKWAYYKHTPEKFINANGTAIMWDVPVITNRTILVNRPDIVLHDKERRLSYWSIWPHQ